MYIKELSLSNFKGFMGEPPKITFNIPDGQTLGSGLNIFVGENNTGKSTVFEAIDFLRNAIKDDLISNLKTKLNDGTQPNDATVELTFCGDIEKTIQTFGQENKKSTFMDYVIGGLDEKNLLKVKRDTAEPKKLYFYQENENEYTNPSGIDAPFKKLFDTNFIWADTNPNDEVAFGSTTLCGLLLKEIAQSHINSKEFRKFQDHFNQLFNNENSDLRQNIKEVENKIQKVFTEQFGKANIHFQFDELKIDSFFKNSSIFIDDGIDVPMSSKGNGMRRVLALSLLQVYAEELAKKDVPDQTKPFFLFIDEPEVCLPPKGQKKLLESLLEISKTKQVFLTTHSPYFLSTPHLNNAGLFIFSKNNMSNQIEKISKDTTLFPWSPTWGEINFKAYNLATVEFHNELYGHLQSISKKYKISEFESWLTEKEDGQIKKTKFWKKDTKDNKPSEDKNQQPNATLQTFIRNHIHHPENTTMHTNLYTYEELQMSIEQMINLIKSNPQP